MRIGLMIDLIDPRLSYLENLKKASSLGFQLVQLWYKDIAAQVKEKPKAFVKILQDLGLSLKSLAAYTDLIDPRRKWPEIFDFMKEAVGYAAEAGVHFVVTESGGVPGRLEEWGEMIGRLRQLVVYVKGAGVCLLVENGPGVLVNDTKLMLKMVDEICQDAGSEAFGINFDPANLNLVPDNVVSAVKKLGSRIKDTHAKDSVLLRDEDSGPERFEGSAGFGGPFRSARPGREVPEEHIFAVPEGEEFIHIPKGVRWALPPIGEGDVPFPEYLAALKKMKFEGDLIIEYQGGGNREKAIVKSRRHLEKVLAKL